MLAEVIRGLSSSSLISYRELFPMIENRFFSFRIFKNGATPA
jgi:hypothetical protein